MSMMPRIRTVKPELFMHEGLFEMAKNYHPLPLQFAFIGLFTCCDREGRFYWQPRRLKASILPYYEVDMSEVLEIFVAHGFVKKYVHQGSWYGCIPSWLKHQVIRHEDESILPPPDDPNWIKPEPNKTHYPCNLVKSDQAFQPSFLVMPPPEIENKNSLKNNELKMSEPSAPRACTRGSRGTRGREGNGMEGKGTEKKGREREKQNIVASMMQPSLMEDPVTFIFQHWQTVMGHPAAKLDAQRKSMIERALKWQYNTEQLCQAIEGCSVTPHNRGERYDGLHIILRNCDQIDRFINNYYYPPHRVTEANRKTAANVQSLQRWINKKIQQEQNYAS